MSEAQEPNKHQDEIELLMESDKDNDYRYTTDSTVDREGERVNIYFPIERRNKKTGITDLVTLKVLTSHTREDLQIVNTMREAAASEKSIHEYIPRFLHHINSGSRLIQVIEYGREAAALEQLKHECIPRFLHHINSGSSLIQVTEYVEGTDLESTYSTLTSTPSSELLARFNDKTVDSLAIQLASALKTVHKTPVKMPIIPYPIPIKPGTIDIDLDRIEYKDMHLVHRNVNPTNILIREESDALMLALINFGIYAEAGENRMSITCAADVFPFGVILHEMKMYAQACMKAVNEDKPFADEPYRIHEDIERIFNTEKRAKAESDLDALVSNLNIPNSPLHTKIVQKCLQFHPEDRYPSGSELLYDMLIAKRTDDVAQFIRDSSEVLYDLPYDQEELLAQRINNFVEHLTNNDSVEYNIPPAWLSQTDLLTDFRNAVEKRIKTYLAYLDLAGTKEENIAKIKSRFDSEEKTNPIKKTIGHYLNIARVLSIKDEQ